MIFNVKTMWKFLPETLKCQKWWSVCLQPKWLWVRIPLLSLNVFVLWDVNVHHKDWLTYSGGTDRSSELCCNFSISNYFTQMVKFPPWIPDCGSHSPALLDFFLSCDASICSTMAFPPLGNSDDVVSVSINFPSFHNGRPHFVALLVTILMLIGTVFVIIWEIFHGRISLNPVLLLLLVNFASGFHGFQLLVQLL